MAAFNYISTLRTNCTPVEECDTELCAPITCDEFRNCLEAYYDATSDLWFTGVDMVLTFHNIGNGECSVCEYANDSWPACAGIPFDWFGDDCVISNRYWALPSASCSYITIASQVSLLSFSKQGIWVGIAYDIDSRAHYRLEGDAWQKAFVKLCSGDPITIPVTYYDDPLGKCDYSDSYVTFQLLPAGTSGCDVPPEVTNICGDMIDCPSDPLLLVSMSYFENFDDAETGFGFPGTRHWLMENLNRGYLLPYTGGGSYEFAADLVASLGDHDAPGIPLTTLTPDDPDWDLERYVHRVLIRVVCSDGEAYIDYINFYFQEFTKTPADPGVWVAGGNNILWQAVSADLEKRSDVGVCYMPLASAFFYFQDFLTAGKGDESHLFLVNCTLGPTA